MLPLQPGILAPLPPVARSLLFSLSTPEDLAFALDNLRDLADGKRTVVGIGLSTIQALGKNIPGLAQLKPRTAGGVDIPSTPMALWCWLRGHDRGELLHRSRLIEDALAPAFLLEQALDTFVHNNGRDLTGYEDGTENPEGDDALHAAFVRDTSPGLNGSSFVALQQWEHDFARFESLEEETQDNMIGRRRRDNEELEDAPASAHVKRTAQESYTPPAFMLRRSMPWIEGQQGGLLFKSFGNSLRAFEAQMTRMSGEEDGIIDALFNFSRPVTGATFWCPPMHEGVLDLSLLAI